MNQNPYYTTLTTMTRSLNALLEIVNKIPTFATSKNMTEEEALALRLALDMLPLKVQITIACDNAKGFVVSMGGVENVIMEDNETTCSQLTQRIQKTIDFVNSVDSASFDQAHTRTKTFPWAPGKFINADEYLTGFILPNFYFHMSMAYAILRSNGMVLSKSDFLHQLNFVESK